MDVGTVQRIDIEQKMRSAYLSYAMSVITARALPDVRDGLKPVQRRILYAMNDMGLRHDQPTRKSARIVGEVLGKYHPHGDVAVYDAMVRLAQDFSMRYVLVEGQGNFGSVDGDGAAAMRYTEARLSPLGEEMLLDLDKRTVDFTPNFDGSLEEPTVLPAKLPNLLVNGAGGIAVGMATNIPPHNLGEVAEAIAYLVDHYDQAEDVSLDELMQFIQGPDFPTGGAILGREGIRQAYATGKGRIVMRALAHVEELRGGHVAIVVTELPYQVNKAGLVERIAELTREGRLEGLSDLRDESDRTGTRVVIELKRGVEPGPVLSDLLKLTQLQCTFGVNMLALVEGEPRVLSLKRILLHYIEHRAEVLTRRTQYELEKALARAHILEGLLIALANLDAVIETIRRSRTAETAQANLCAKFKLTEIQARAILDLQLRRLAALERQKIEEEHRQVLRQIQHLQDLLAHKDKILALVKQDVLELKARFGDPRRTRICEESESASVRPADLAPDEDVVLLFTQGGAARRLSQALWAQELARLGPEALPGLAPAEGDPLLAALPAHSREDLLILTDLGRVYRLPVHQVPDIGQQPRGLPLGNLVHMEPAERLVAVLSLPAPAGVGFLTLVTRQGKVKRLALGELEGVGPAGAEVIGLGEGDRLGWALHTGGQDELVLVSAQGRAIRFQEETVRPQGRSAGGMRGLTLQEEDVVAGADLARPGGQLLVATALGFAKRVPLDEFNVQGRGGLGVLAVDAAKLPLTGPVVAASVVLPQGEMALVTSAGALARLPVAQVPLLDRAGWGRLVSKSRRGAAIQVGEGRLVAAVPLPMLGPQPPPSPSPKARSAKKPSPTGGGQGEGQPSPTGRGQAEGQPSPTGGGQGEGEPSPTGRGQAEGQPRPRRAGRTAITQPPRRK